MNNIHDDGSLSCLNIPRDVNNKSFNCDVTNQSKLLNTQFWVEDFVEDIKTRYTKISDERGQTLVKIRLDNGEFKKFFTGSKDILYILQQLRKMDKFPRRVTLRGNGRNYYFE